MAILNKRRSNFVYSLVPIVTVLFATLGCGVEAISHNHPKALLPEECCSAMTPVHPYAMAPYRNATENIPVQDNKDCPFSITTDKSNIKPGDSVELTIKSKDPESFSFKGYVVVAVKKNDTNGSTIGSFIDVSDGRYMNCPRGLLPSNTVTHDDVENKTSVTVKWVAPENFEGEVVFMASYVQNYYTFWANVSGEGQLLVGRSSALTPVSSSIAILCSVVTLLATWGVLGD